MLKFIPNEAALLLETRKEKILLISDLHLGFEKALALRGVKIPSQTDKIYQRVEKLVRETKPDQIIFLGDVKHGTSKILAYEWLDIPIFFEKLLKEVSLIQIIPGNHDGGLNPLLPRGVEMTSSKGLTIKDGVRKIMLIHGHAWPNPEAFASDILIMGHHHFTIQFKHESGFKTIEPVWIIGRWNKEIVLRRYLDSQEVKINGKGSGRIFESQFGLRAKVPKIVVMPTFNQMLGGSPINAEWNQKYIGPIFGSGAVSPNTIELYFLDGTFLGKLSELSKISSSQTTTVSK